MIEKKSQKIFEKGLKHYGADAKRAKNCTRKIKTCRKKLDKTL